MLNCHLRLCAFLTTGEGRLWLGDQAWAQGPGPGWNEGRPTAQKLVLIERDTEDYRSFLADGRLLLCCYVLLQEKPASLAGDVRKCMELAEQQPVRLRRSRDACMFDVKTLQS